MHLAVETRLAQDLGAVGLEGAPVVVESHAGDAADEPVGDARRRRRSNLSCRSRRQPLTTS